MTHWYNKREYLRVDFFRYLIEEGGSNARVVVAQRLSAAPKLVRRALLSLLAVLPLLLLLPLQAPGQFGFDAVR
jgi:hypothetical protein